MRLLLLFFVSLFVTSTFVFSAPVAEEDTDRVAFSDVWSKFKEWIHEKSPTSDDLSALFGRIKDSVSVQLGQLAEKSEGIRKFISEKFENINLDEFRAKVDEFVGEASDRVRKLVSIVKEGELIEEIQVKLATGAELSKEKLTEITEAISELELTQKAREKLNEIKEKIDRIDDHYEISETVSEKYTQVSENLFDLTSDMKEDVVNWYKEDFLPNAKEKYEELSDDIEENWKRAQEVANSTWAKTKETLGPLAEELAKSKDAALEWAKSLNRELGDQLTETSGATNKFIDSLGRVGSELGKIGSQAAEKAREWGGVIGEKATEASAKVKDTLTNAGDFFRSLFQ